MNSEQALIWNMRAFGIGNFFQNIGKNSWGPMNDYTHSGIRQIGRRFKYNVVEPNYESCEIVEVLNGINVTLMLMAIVFLRRLEKLKLQATSKKCLPNIQRRKNWIHKNGMVGLPTAFGFRQPHMPSVRLKRKISLRINIIDNLHQNHLKSRQTGHIMS